MSNSNALYREFVNDIKSEGKPSLKDNLMLHMNRLAWTHLDINKVPSEQEENVNLVKSELVSNWPSYFSGKKEARRKELAYYMICKIHGNHRFHKKSTKSGREQVQTQISASTNNTSHVSAHNHVDFTQTKTQTKTSASTYNASTVSARNHDNYTTLTASGSASFRGDVAEGNIVRIFLEDCIPSMGRFTRAFIAYGCVDKQHLIAVSKWSPVQVSEFVKRVAEKAKEPISDMEIDILQIRLLQFEA